MAMIMTGPPTQAYRDGWDRAFGEKKEPEKFDDLHCQKCGKKLIWCQTCEDYSMCPTHNHGWDNADGPDGLVNVYRSQVGFTDGDGV